MTKICLFAILLCSCLLLTTIECINFENILKEIDELRSVGANSTTGVREKRSSANYWPYDIWYYHYWYYYNYYPTVFTVSQCGNYHCPSQCPGTCGSYSGYFACKCNRCLNVNDPCTHYNIARGYYLHPFPHDATRYIQCDSTPGVLYIRSCPSGLVFDSRSSVCNYGYYYHGK